MPNFGDKLKINSSNGLSLRDGPNTRGTILRKLDNESIVTIVEPPAGEYQLAGGYVWAYVEARDGEYGWIATDNGRGEKYASVIYSEPKKSKPKRRRRYRASKGTDSE